MAKTKAPAKTSPTPRPGEGKGGVDPRWEKALEALKPQHQKFLASFQASITSGRVIGLRAENEGRRFALIDDAMGKIRPS